MQKDGRTVEAMTLRGEATSAEGVGRPDEVLAVPRDLDGPVDSDRSRLAYEIHDGLTQVVTASVLELESLAHRAEIGPSEAAEANSWGLYWMSGSVVRCWRQRTCSTA